MATLIKCGNLIDGTGGPPMKNAQLLVEGDRIAAIDPTAEETIPPGTDIIDLGGSTVLPGMIDCHTHLKQHFTNLHSLQRKYVVRGGVHAQNGKRGKTAIHIAD